MLIATAYSSPKVAVAGSTLVIGESGLTPAGLAVYDVSTTPATLRGRIDGHDNKTGFLGSLAITPDGSTVVAAFLGVKEYGAWDTTSLRKVRTYGPDPASGSYSPVVAVSADGTHIACGWGPEPAMGVTLYDSATTAATYTDISPDHAFEGTYLLG
ncbi:hypothetical protein ACQPZZ_22340 [Microbispora sp. CA-135349]|uniref:hypothetical protein n=1 Tax=Microbispora sp. CA-135349 TaxID=3239953 RepID=UPI003D8CE48B